jgi:thiamine biosynthesis lipoprotein
LPSVDAGSAIEDSRRPGLWRASFTAMGGSCEVLCETTDARLARRLGEYARSEARRIDRKYSRAQPGSVVCAINARKGKRYRVDDETAKLLDYGAALWRVSDGAFDLTSGLLRHAWNSDTGMVRVDPERIPDLLKRVGWSYVGWQPADIILPDGMEIDFGGIGKEYAVDRVAEWARTQTNCPVLVNFGGDLRCVGKPPAEGAWTVVNESIAANGKSGNRVKLSSGALASSGDASHPIIDARTGWPADGAPLSITVAAATCSQASSYSTLAMLQGAGAEAFLEAEGVRYWALR